MKENGNSAPAMRGMIKRRVPTPVLLTESVPAVRIVTAVSHWLGDTPTDGSTVFTFMFPATGRMIQPVVSIGEIAEGAAVYMEIVYNDKPLVRIPMEKGQNAFSEVDVAQWDKVAVRFWREDLVPTKGMSGVNVSFLYRA